MKVGVCEATELKKRSEMLSIPFADLLWGYAVEDLMLRVSTSAYREFLWLMSLPLLGEEAYRQRAKKRIRFFIREVRKNSRRTNCSPVSDYPSQWANISKQHFCKRKCTENPLGRYGDGIERRNPA